VVEAVVGFKADSLSFLMDSVHKLSDEMALVFLYLAFVLPHGISRHLLRSANVFNSVGLVLVSGLLLWQAAERILHPAPVVGSVAIVVGLLAAANWGVARLLLAPSRNNAAIRLAYIHNIGDVYVSSPEARWYRRLHESCWSNRRATDPWTVSCCERWTRHADEPAQSRCRSFGQPHHAQLPVLL
jgi:hypothetical protein